MLPPVAAFEQHFLKIIGKARKSTHRMVFEKIDDLLNRSKGIYSPSKTVYQSQGKLASTYMGKRESVLSYTTRIREIRDQIYDPNRIKNE